MNEENTVSSSELIDELYAILEKSWSMPLSHGRVVVDSNEARQILSELRDSLPKEIEQARGIVAERGQILDKAQKRAEGIIHAAEERAKVLLNQEAILQQAQKMANDLIVTTQKQTREMRRASSEYVDDLMRRAEDSLSTDLTELRGARQSIHDITAHAGKVHAKR